MTAVAGGAATHLPRAERRSNLGARQPSSGVRVGSFGVPAALDHRPRNRPHPPAVAAERRASAGLVSTDTGDRLVHPLNSERAHTMKRLSLLLLGGIAVVAVAACGGGAPPQPVTPQQNVDSIAQAEKARQDSIDPAAADAPAREGARRPPQPRTPDPPAG